MDYFPSPLYKKLTIVVFCCQRWACFFQAVAPFKIHLIDFLNHLGNLQYLA
jgi:hypothetical protein